MSTPFKRTVETGYDRIAERYLASKTPKPLRRSSSWPVNSLGRAHAVEPLRRGDEPRAAKEDNDVPTTITGAVALDVRFPTSSDLSGSDAMNEAPDYSAAYVILETDTELEGHGLTFTIGRGNELCVAAIEALAPLVVGETLESFAEDMGLSGAG